ncbi:hypothetical protein LIER_14431 [Lithospermum erythrorhizon]|uniref:Uncharacterized protein n=1 Tax=Lithospermum erythrorhizon TaxID=34254 RepID=A0AAV3Q4F2_LITER
MKSESKANQIKLKNEFLNIEEMVNLGVVKVVSEVTNLGIDYVMEEGETIEDEGEIIADTKEYGVGVSGEDGQNLINE